MLWEAAESAASHFLFRRKIMVTINGTAYDLAGKTILEYLTKAGYDTKRIAVECNERIIPKTQYAQIVLKNDDVLEVVSFVGGG